MDIAVIGSNMVDLITYIDRMPKEGETLEAPSFEMGCGGKGANQAVAAAKLGSKVMMVTKTGDDLFSDMTIQNLKSYGIDTEFTVKEPGTSSGVAPIFVDPESQNRILIIKGANNCLKPEDIDRAARKIKQSSLIVLQLEVPLETVYYAIDFGKKLGIPILLNPAPANSDLDFDYVTKCDFFIPNETELEMLTGTKAETEEDIETAANYLLENGVKNVIVTLGSRGVLWMTEGRKERIPAYKVNAIDSTGAGDAFIGCFSHYYVKEKDLIKAIHMANAYAALSVTKRGTQKSYASSEEFASFLAENKTE